MLLPKKFRSQYMTSSELADRFGICPSTLRVHRRNGYDLPPHVKFGNRVYYKIKSVIKWEEIQLQEVSNVKPIKESVRKWKMKRKKLPAI